MGPDRLGRERRPPTDAVGPFVLDSGWRAVAAGERWWVSSDALERLGVVFTVQAPADPRPACSPEPVQDPTRTYEFVVHGVVWSAVEGWLGCRNARPPEVHACAVVHGQHVQVQYSPRGCRGGPGAFGGAAELTELLSALRPATR